MIARFQGKYSFLSNFHPSIVLYEGWHYPSVEHAYQAAKTLDESERKRIWAAENPAMAKKIGKKVKMRPDWNKVKLDIMRGLLTQKFSLSPFREMLLATGDTELVEGNWWGDTFWGVSGGKGQNHLGRLLMEIRDAEKLWISTKQAIAEGK